MSNIKLGVLSILMLITTACGDLWMSKDKKVQLNQFSVCKLDTKRFSKIFTERIDDQLVCLEENLNLFIDIVKTDKPGYLGLKELKNYVSLHFKDEIDPDVFELMDQVFNISGLMYGEDPNYISKDNVSKLIKLFDFINEQLVKSDFYSFFEHESAKISYSEHNRRKAWIFAAIERVGKRLAEEIVLENNSNVINLNNFLQSFYNETNKDTLEKLKKMFFVKKIFLGGNEEYITAKELKRLGNMAGDIGKVAFDLWKIDEVAELEDQQEEIINTLKSDVESLLGHLAYGRYEQIRLFTIYNVFDVLDLIAPKFEKYKKYKDELLKLKEVFLESKSAAFTPNELHILVEDIVLKNLKLGAFFYRAFRLNASFLKTPKPLNYGIKDSFYMNEEERNFKQIFNHIVKDYRYLIGPEQIPYFSYEHKRSPQGMIQMALFEDILKRVMAFYGDKKSSAKGGYRLTHKQIIKIVYEFKDFLLGEKIMYDGFLEDSSKIITLISSLFQPHSDGDADIEVDELVEFMTSTYAAYNISGLMIERLEKVCRLDHKNRFSPVCFRSNFKSMLSLKTSNGKRILDLLPQLYKFLMGTNYAGRWKYYVRTEKFTRTCTTFKDGSDVPMSRGDIFLVVSGMLTIEQTFIRFDTNKNNILDPKEVDYSYGTYANAIKAIVPGDFLKKWSKDFYLYLMKYEKVPDVKDVGFFHAVGQGMDFVLYKAFRNKNTSASRFTLASVLKVIGDQTSTKEFPCETLR